MMDHIIGVGVAVMKRAVSDDDQPSNLVLPYWALAVLFVEALIFLPVILYTNYTLHSLFPTLAMVEDPSPPAYEPVPLNADADGDDEDVASAPAAVAPQPTTASLRAINRLLYSVGGWRANFRGLGCALALAFATSLTGSLFSGVVPFLPHAVGRLLASLALLQLSAAWVHIAIGAPPRAAEGDMVSRPRPFWRRLPPLRRTFEATCFPVLLDFAATLAARDGALLLASALGLPAWDPSNPKAVPMAGAGASWKVLVVGLFGLSLQFLAVVPARVALVRVQASLLPPEEDSIVPFDRSFGGRVDPALVGGKGYVSARDALLTFPRAAWVRLYVLYGKILLVGSLIGLVVAAVLIPEVLLFGTEA